MNANELIGKKAIRVTPPKEYPKDISFMKRPITIDQIRKDGEIDYSYNTTNSARLQKAWNDDNWIEVPDQPEESKPNYCPHCGEEIIINIGISS